MSVRGALGGLVVCASVVASCGGGVTVMDLPVVETQLEDWASEIGAAGGVVADCGDTDVRVEIDARFDCSLSDDHGTYPIHVTVLNEEGDLEWIADILDLASAEDQIKAWAAENGAVGTVDLDCSTGLVPLEPDFRFVCTMSDDSGTFSLLITVLNNRGDIEWEVRG